MVIPQYLARTPGLCGTSEPRYWGHYEAQKEDEFDRLRRNEMFGNLVQKADPGGRWVAWDHFLFARIMDKEIVT